MSGPGTPLQAALAALRAGRVADAIATCESLLAQTPLEPNALQLLALAHFTAGNLEAAEETTMRAIRAAPVLADNYGNLALIQLRRGRPAEALATCDDALKVHASFKPAMHARCAALIALDRYAEAVAACDATLALDPRSAEAHNNRAVALRGLGRLNDAAADVDAALALRPDFADAQVNRSYHELVRGRFETGLPPFEYRPTGTRGALQRRDLPAALWLGAEPLEGRSILLHAEQGLGDTLQFARYAPLVAALGAHVVLEVQRPLHRLLAATAGVEVVIAAGDPVPRTDYRCPLLSLPLAFETRIDSIPLPETYVVAPPIEERLRLPPATRRRIGLVWSGNPGHQNDRNRSIPFSELAPLLRDVDAEFHLLQTEIRARDRAALAAFPTLVDHAARIGDFADTAALVAQMDLVVSADTSVLHLAGAMSRPVWGLIPFMPDWRWLLRRSDSPWYPTMRLFRQPAHGDWASVVARVTAALKG